MTGLFSERAVKPILEICYLSQRFPTAQPKSTCKLDSFHRLFLAAARAFALFSSGPVRSRLAGFWMDEERGILGAQSHILVANNRAAPARTQKFNFHLKTMQVFRLPKSHLESDSRFRR